MKGPPGSVTEAGGFPFREAAGRPTSVEELRARARSLAGRTIGEVARELAVAVPDDPRRAKGFIGLLAESALGAPGGSHAGPDFPTLGVELKTIPVDRGGRPRESTFVCTIALRHLADRDPSAPRAIEGHGGVDGVRTATPSSAPQREASDATAACPWRSSLIRRKLARVLWLPIETADSLDYAARRFGAPLFWSPNAAEDAILRADFDELVGRIGRGDIETVTAHLGEALQVRPKAAHGGVRTAAIEADGSYLWTVPRGFYLRARFTSGVLARLL